MQRKIEFRACQLCGQIEKVSTDEVIVQGAHPDRCSNDVSHWIIFSEPDDWRPDPKKPKPKIIFLSTEGWSDLIANFALGFVRLIDTPNGQDAKVAGTGTLVRVGRVFGVLTAAHVLQKLPSTGHVGISQFFRSEVHFRKHLICMDYAERILLGGEGNGSKGPDLGFLRLDPKDVGWINALMSFYNLVIHSKDHEKELPSPNKMTCVIGAIDERTESLPAERPGEFRKGFQAVTSDGNIMAINDINGFELIDFSPKSYPDFKLPADYGGTSGGSLWDVFFVEEETTVKAVGIRLAGVPFYQSEAGKDGRRVLTCHSVKDVFGHLMKAISEKWPDDSSAAD